MLQANRLFAAAATIAIITVIVTFAYGYFTGVLEQYFSFSLQSLAVKSILAVVLMMMVFFGRPPSQVRRVTYGIVATIALGFGAFGAFTSSLLLGDALVLIVGTIITAIEATVGEATQKSTRPARTLPAKPKAQQL